MTKRGLRIINICYQSCLSPSFLSKTKQFLCSLLLLSHEKTHEGLLNFIIPGLYFSNWFIFFEGRCFEWNQCLRKRFWFWWFWVWVFALGFWNWNARKRWLTSHKCQDAVGTKVVDQKKYCEVTKKHYKKNTFCIFLEYKKYIPKSLKNIIIKSYNIFWIFSLTFLGDFVPKK